MEDYFGALLNLLPTGRGLSRNLKKDSLLGQIEVSFELAGQFLRCAWLYVVGIVGPVFKDPSKHPDITDKFGVGGGRHRCVLEAVLWFRQQSTVNSRQPWIGLVAAWRLASILAVRVGQTKEKGAFCFRAGITIEGNDGEALWQVPARSGDSPTAHVGPCKSDSRGVHGTTLRGGRNPIKTAFWPAKFQRAQESRINSSNVCYTP
ncbi:hypothetical protein B0H63DRAFT_88372 [Podospora didyma]|uniref:Uncharacterized protein n=1 Tax=Podospora didyma TaxID=330526 RepID=A0AAE0K1W2_9PEZI|nr:hypothetical protein B0H63DRAFT_88372 [Podospora didyma]